jgi:broad specificity phosphatase PhoE
VTAQLHAHHFISSTWRNRSQRCRAVFWCHRFGVRYRIFRPTLTPPSRLTVHGMNQATSLGERLKNESVTHIFSSDLKRAFRTASAVAGHHPHITVVTDKLFREQNFGDLEGKPWRQTWIPETGKSSETHTTFPNGESKEEMKKRAVSAWNLVLQSVEADNQTSDLFVIIVSHGLFLRTLFNTICVHYNTTSPTNVSWSNTGYTKFTVDQSRDPSLKVDRINETGHLAAVQRQKVGVGSSKFDESQKTIKDFFISRPTE